MSEPPPASLPEFKGNVIAVPTGTFWDEPLSDIQAKYGKVKQMRHLLNTKNKNTPNKDGSMSADDQKAYLAKSEVDLITPEEAVMRKRGASNAGYHYLGCAKTFADAVLEMRK